MLDKIREKKSGVLTWAFTIIIIVVFIAFFGPGSFRKTRKGCGVTAYAAKVNGRIIGEDDFRFAYQSRRREMSARSGGKLDYNMEKALNVKQLVMDELIDLEVITDAAARSGLVIPEDELNKSIMENPAFQTNGRFDYQLYNKIVRYNFHVSPKKYEDRHRARLLAMKMVELEKGAIKLPDDELWDEYYSQNNKVNLQIAVFDPALFRKNAAASEKEINEALKSAREKAEAWYKSRESEYNTPKKVRARHILVRTGQGASEGEVKEAKAKAEKLLAELKAGTSFEDLAGKNSDDPGSKEKGGDLDWFEKGRMVREFEDAAFSLKKGETTQQPVKSDFGFHIIRVDDIREAVTVSFKDVEHSVAKAMIEDEKAAKAAEASAVAALAAMKAGKALHEIYPPEPSGEGSKKDEGRIYSKETGMFAKSGGYLPGVGIAQDLVDDAFAATKENPVLGKVYKSGQRFLVAVLKEKAAVQKADFEKEKDAFRQKAAFSRQAAVINDWVKAMRESAKVDINTDLVSYDVKPERERNPDQY